MHQAAAAYGRTAQTTQSPRELEAVYHDELEDHQPRGGRRQRSFGAHRPVRHGRKDALDGVRRPQMVPVLGREVVEGEQGIPVLGQALGGFGVLGAVLLGEDRDRRLGRGPGRGAVDLAQDGSRAGRPSSRAARISGPY